MQPTSLNYGGEHFKRIDRMDDDELTNIYDRVGREQADTER